MLIKLLVRTLIVLNKYQLSATPKKHCILFRPEFVETEQTDEPPIMS